MIQVPTSGGNYNVRLIYLAIDIEEHKYILMWKCGRSRQLIVSFFEECLPCSEQAVKYRLFTTGRYVTFTNVHFRGYKRKEIDFFIPDPHPKLLFSMVPDAFSRFSILLKTSLSITVYYAWAPYLFEHISNPASFAENTFTLSLNYSNVLFLREKVGIVMMIHKIWLWLLDFGYWFHCAHWKKMCAAFIFI